MFELNGSGMPEPKQNVSSWNPRFLPYGVRTLLYSIHNYIAEQKKVTHNTEPANENSCPPKASILLVIAGLGRTNYVQLIVLYLQRECYADMMDEINRE